MIHQAIEAHPEALALKARESMTRHGVPDTPQNFWIWHSYHSGANPDLNRAIDIMLSNRREFSEETNDEIFERFLGTMRENEIIRETTQRVIGTLDVLMQFVSEVSARATSYKRTLADLSSEMVAGKPLSELVGALMDETKTIEQQSRLLQQRLASSSSTISQLRRNLEDVQREALTDALTGIANRKLFDMTLRQAAIDVMESGEELGLLLIDIDHFKRFNDTWGHQTGDEVLKLVAKTLRTDLRDIDLAARYGGEEFAAILPKAALGETLAIAERIRHALETRTLTERETGKDIGSITVSIGAALFDPGESLPSFIGRADEALYSAKHAGRNQVVAASSRA
jgi:diguanylate cyclase